LDEDLVVRTGRPERLVGAMVGGGRDVEALLPLRWGLLDVGCVGPFASGRACVMLAGSRGSSMKVGTVEAVDAVEATEAEWARKADSSRVSLFT
jgi:hypothetical protein